MMSKPMACRTRDMVEDWMHDERDAALTSAWDRIERVRRALGGVITGTVHRLLAVMMAGEGVRP